ncbi:MAG: hypothetical protein JNJ94_08370 [Chlorobi bacterium]|nr:hypothetical protein [Chlorobiota bacterium]
MEIRINDLRRIADILLEHIGRSHQVVELDKDFYWHIPKAEIYNPYSKPADLTLGQLHDDWENLQELLSEKPQPLEYHLVRFAALCRAIGEKCSE